MNTYIASVDNSDMQAAIWEVLGDNVPEEFAESVLDTFIESTSVIAVSGCSSEEEAQCIKTGLITQLIPLKDDVSMYLNELYAEME